MKFSKLLFAIAFVLIAFGMEAKNHDPYFSTKVTGQKSIMLSLTNIMGKGQLKIKNESGTLIFAEEITTDSFKKEYNLERLPSGNYVLILTDDIKQYRMDIQLGKDLLAEFSSVYFFPVIIQDEHIISVSKLNIGQEEIQISIYDCKDRLLQSDVLSGNNFVGKKYDFSAVPKGSYRIYISGKYHDVLKNIEVK